MRRWREWREARAEHRAVVEEMEFHIEQETEHNLRNGMLPREARRAAKKAFGGIDRYAEAARDERPGAKLWDFAMSYLDWKLGARMLLKYPGLSVVGGITLAAAIGLGAGWFEMSMLMLYPELPLEDGDRIVRIDIRDAAASEVEPRALYEFHEWRGHLTSIEQLGAYRTIERNLITDDGIVQPVVVAQISAVAFPLTRVPPLLGRPLTDADEQPGAPDVLVIGHDIWQRRFGGARNIIGREVQLGRTTVSIVGVMPAGFAFPLNHQLWTPLRSSMVPPRAGPAIGLFGRLEDRATLESAQAELTAISARMAAANPETHAQLRPHVLPFAAPAPNTGFELLLVNVFAWFLLGAACVNVATLMFARTAMREPEIVVRNALGATRARVMGQLFTEALVLTSAAAILGLAAAGLVIGYVFRLSEVQQRRLPFWFDSGIEPITLLYTAGLAVAGAAVVGLLPALRATGSGVQASLARISAGGTSMRFGGVWSVVIVLQVAFSVICLPFGIAAVREAAGEHRVRSEFPSDAFLTFRPELDSDAGPAAAAEPDQEAARERTERVIAELSQRLENEPGVIGVTVAAALPGTYHPLRQVEVQRGAEGPVLVAANTEGNRVRIASVGADFFETFRIPVAAGRAFHAGDVGAQNGVVVINESMAQNLGGNPIGVRLRYAGRDDAEPGPWYEVVGVVGNLGLTPTARGEADYMFFPVSAADARFVAVHVTGDAMSFAPQLRTIAAQVDPGLRMYDVLSLREVIRRYDLPALQIVLIGVGVVLLAILLSAASLYALMSVAVALRTREIGIRVAIGASSRAVLSSLFARAAAQIGAGIIIGNLLVVVIIPFIGIQNIRASVVIPPMLIASAVMALVGFVACLVPGRRALRVEPTVALKAAR
ncbi:MAG TPA: ABC transporter permease [Longimicrobiales bacterium]|nr:ABC transporter permease [Longimicrobiales bacterium]